MIIPLRGPALGIALGVLLFGGWIGYEQWQDHERAKRTAAEVKVDQHASDVAALKDSVKSGIPGVAKTDSALTGILQRPRPVAPAPRIIVDTVAGVIDSSRWVPLEVHQRDSTRYDSLATAATAYRDSTRAQLLRFPRLVAEQDSVIRYQKVLIDTPKPRRNLGFGISGGYGLVLVDNTVKIAPSIHVGVSYSF